MPRMLLVAVVVMCAACVARTSAEDAKPDADSPFADAVALFEEYVDEARAAHPEMFAGIPLDAAFFDICSEYPCRPTNRLPFGIISPISVDDMIRVFQLEAVNGTDVFLLYESQDVGFERAAIFYTEDRRAPAFRGIRVGETLAEARWDPAWDPAAEKGGTPDRRMITRDDGVFIVARPRPEDDRRLTPESVVVGMGFDRTGAVTPFIPADFDHLSDDWDARLRPSDNDFGRMLMLEYIVPYEVTRNALGGLTQPVVYIRDRDDASGVMSPSYNYGLAVFDKAEGRFVFTDWAKDAFATGDRRLGGQSLQRFVDVYFSEVFYHLFSERLLNLDRVCNTRVSPRLRGRIEYAMAHHHASEGRVVAPMADLSVWPESVGLYEFWEEQSELQWEIVATIECGDEDLDLKFGFHGPGTMFWRPERSCLKEFFFEVTFPVGEG